MDKQTQVQQVVAQARIEDKYQGKAWEPYPQPRAWAMRWDSDGLDHAVNGDESAPAVHVTPEE